jgi:hypothetical protein
MIFNLLLRSHYYDMLSSIEISLLWYLIIQRQFSNFAARSWREQVNFQLNDYEIRFVLDQHAELDFHSASSLKQQSAGRHIAPLGHIIHVNKYIWPTILLEISWLWYLVLHWDLMIMIFNPLLRSHDYEI